MYLPGLGGYLPGGCVPARGVYLPGPGGVPGQVPPPVDRMTHACENITLAKTSFRPVKRAHAYRHILLDEGTARWLGCHGTSLFIVKITQESKL